MMCERIEGFISDLTYNIQYDSMLWDFFSNLFNYDKILKEFMITTGSENYRGYLVNAEKSYYLKVGLGYVFLLNLYYSNKQLFSPSLDKNILLVKINNSMTLENLSIYGDFNDKVNILYSEVEEQLYRKSPMPEALYEFMEKVISEAGKRG